MKTVALGDVLLEVRTGPFGSLLHKSDYVFGGIPLVNPMHISDGRINSDPNYTISEEKAATLTGYMLKAGDIVMGRRGEMGRCAVVRQDDGPQICGTGSMILSPDPRRLDSDYAAHLLRSPEARKFYENEASGVTMLNLNPSAAAKLTLPLPPLEEQKRIAAILDQADDLRRKRQRALDRLNQLRQAIFVEMFGDPAINPMGWPKRSLGELAEKFSDGPFGSNLKSEHYVERGIRVIRLQNVGVGELIDNDQAFISEEHFRSLAKHACIPGDVIVGTMGDPNLRACILPTHVELALNKADCVQIRPNKAVATGYFVCSLLNHPSTERMAHDLILGQTRARISMGRLKGLNVPTPPLNIQNDFGHRVAEIEKLYKKYGSALIESNVLFTSLQHRAFRGEL